MERKELTKEQAVRLHRDMWLWIAKKIARYKKPMEIGGLKQIYIRCYTDFDSVVFGCFACEYAKQKVEEELKKGHEFFRCRFCPFNWGTSGDEDGNFMCDENITDNESGYGLYAKCKGIWYESLRIGSEKDLYKRQVKLAYKIATLPEKE